MRTNKFYRPYLQLGIHIMYINGHSGIWYTNTVFPFSQHNVFLNSEDADAFLCQFVTSRHNVELFKLAIRKSEENIKSVHE